MESLADEWHAYINRRTGEVIGFSDEEASLAEEDVPQAEDWQQALLPKIREALTSDDYVRLPGKYEFHEYQVMERFCLQLHDKRLRDELLDAIRGRGAFRRFKAEIYRAGVEDDWYAFRDRAIRDLAVEFLDAEGIPYREK